MGPKQQAFPVKLSDDEILLKINEYKDLYEFAEVKRTVSGLPWWSSG